jgi:hypothetical protein
MLTAIAAGCAPRLGLPGLGKTPTRVAGVATHPGGAHPRTPARRGQA